MRCLNCHLCLGFLGLKLLGVEVWFFAFEDIAVSTSALTWSRANFSEQFILKKLRNQIACNFGVFLTGIVLLFGSSTAVGLFFYGGFLFLGEFVALLTA